MSERIHVTAADELAPGDREIVATKHGSIGVFNIDGEYYALENTCQHQGGPVCTGKQQGAVEAEFVAPGERVEESFSEEVPAIACPWHGWEYDVRTGHHLGDPDPAYKLDTFDVVEDDGDLYVEL